MDLKLVFIFYLHWQWWNLAISYHCDDIFTGFCYLFKPSPPLQLSYLSQVFHFLRWQGFSYYRKRNEKRRHCTQYHILIRITLLYHLSYWLSFVIYLLLILIFRCSKATIWWFDPKAFLFKCVQGSRSKKSCYCFCRYSIWMACWRRGY